MKIFDSFVRNFKTTCPSIKFLTILGGIVMLRNTIKLAHFVYDNFFKKSFDLLQFLGGPPRPPLHCKKIRKRLRPNNRL